MGFRVYILGGLGVGHVGQDTIQICIATYGKCSRRDLFLKGLRFRRMEGSTKCFIAILR